MKKINKNYNLLIGRFCPLKKTLSESLEEAIDYKSNCLMMYLGSPHNSKRNIDYSDLEVKKFRNKLLENNILIENVIIHAPYIINLGNMMRKEVFEWSVKFLIKEIVIMEKIGLVYIVIHPGNSLLKSNPIDSMNQISQGLNTILNETEYVKILLETTCKKGGEIGWNLENLEKIIDNIDKKNKERIGICWDTCHLYSAGYDIKSENGLDDFINLFDKIIGLKKLFLIHVNDSKGGFGENIDRHENIGLGKIGLESLKRIVWHPKLDSIPKILETPRNNKNVNLCDEINLLRNF